MKVPDRVRVSVCVVRVETQADRAIITVTVHRDVDRNLYSVRAEPSERYVEPESALDAVARFLTGSV